MNCWHCKTELIWGGDHDIGHEDDTYSMVTNLSCPNCEQSVMLSSIIIERLTRSEADDSI